MPVIDPEELLKRWLAGEDTADISKGLPITRERALSVIKRQLTRARNEGRLLLTSKPEEG